MKKEQKTSFNWLLILGCSAFFSMAFFIGLEIGSKNPVLTVQESHDYCLVNDYVPKDLTNQVITLTNELIDMLYKYNNVSITKVAYLT